VGKSGVLEHKSGNISETRKDRGKVTMEGLQELTISVSNGTISDFLRPPLPQFYQVYCFASNIRLVHHSYSFNKHVSTTQHVTSLRKS